MGRDGTGWDGMDEETNERAETTEVKKQHERRYWNELSKG